jgi:hypothetical protein
MLRLYQYNILFVLWSSGAGSGTWRGIGYVSLYSGLFERVIGDTAMAI